MCVQVQEEQLSSHEPDRRRESSSKPDLVVGRLHILDGGHGSLSRLLVHFKGHTFRSADEFLNRLQELDPKVGYPWRILSTASLAPTEVVEREWQSEPQVRENSTPKLGCPTRLSTRFPSAIEAFGNKLVSNPEPTPPSSAGDWGNRLLQSELFESRYASMGRTAPKLADVQALLAAIEVAGGKLTASALANSIQKSPTRLRGFLAVTQRLLNVDGYQALNVDTESNTVELDTSLITRQFQLSPEAPGRSGSE